MVECDLAKVEVAGSNPVSRSRYRDPRRVRGFLAWFLVFQVSLAPTKCPVCALWGERGAVAKW